MPGVGRAQGGGSGGFRPGSKPGPKPTSGKPPRIRNKKAKAKAAAVAVAAAVQRQHETSAHSSRARPLVRAAFQWFASCLHSVWRHRRLLLSKQPLLPLLSQRSVASSQRSSSRDRKTLGHSTVPGALSVHRLAFGVERA